MTKRPWVGKRRRLLKRVEKIHKNRPLGWRNGILYFTDDNTPVEGIPKVPKVKCAVIDTETT